MSSETRSCVVTLMSSSGGGEGEAETMPDAREVNPGLAMVRRTVSSVRSILRNDFVRASCFLQIGMH